MGIYSITHLLTYSGKNQEQRAPRVRRQAPGQTLAPCLPAGVSAQPLFPQLADFLDVPVDDGAVVAEVESGSPADEAGLRGGTGERDFQGYPDFPVGGDVIVSVDGEKLSRTEDLADVIAHKNEGDEVELEVIRDGDRRKVEVTLTRRPVQAPRRP